MGTCTWSGDPINYHYQNADVTSTSANLNSSCWIGWTASTANTQIHIWKYWNSEVRGADIQEPQIMTLTNPTRTPKEIQRQRLNDAKSRGIQKREEKQKAEIKNRAKKLLMSLIGKTDYKKFLQLGYLDIEGNSGKTYRIRPRGRIEVREGDVKIDSLCITTPDYYLPKCDEVVWKKLLAENNEKLLLEVANH